MPHDYQNTETCNTMEAQSEAFRDRVNEIMAEAQSYGFSSMFALCAHDPMNKECVSSYAVRGNEYAVSGMMRSILYKLESSE